MRVAMLLALVCAIFAMVVRASETEFGVFESALLTDIPATLRKPGTGAAATLPGTAGAVRSATIASNAIDSFAHSVFVTDLAMGLDSFKCDANYKLSFKVPGGPSSNGCGAGTEAWATFNKGLALVTPGGFETCCNTHDIGYGTCGSRKSQIDQRFRECMLRVAGTSLEKRVAAQSFYRAVANFGYSPFREAQTEMCMCVHTTTKARGILRPSFIPNPNTMSRATMLIVNQATNAAHRVAAGVNKVARALNALYTAAAKNLNLYRDTARKEVVKMMTTATQNVSKRAGVIGGVTSANAAKSKKTSGGGGSW